MLWFKKKGKKNMDKYTNISKFSSRKEATAAFMKECKARGITPTIDLFNEWCFATAAECLDVRPFTKTEAIERVMGSLVTNGNKVMVITCVEGDENAPLINGVPAFDFARDWREYHTKMRCGMVVDEK